MLTCLLAMATTSLVGDAEREKGFEGRRTAAKSPGRDRSCRWRVESHDAEMSRLCEAEKRMLRTPAECVDMTVWEPVSRSILHELATRFNLLVYRRAHVPPHFPVQSACEGLVVVATKTDI